MNAVTLLLPPRERFAGEALPVAVARVLGRCNVSRACAGIESLFDVVPRGWPAAAVLREVECGDAAGAAWVRADPAFIRPDINGARLLGIGDMLGLDVTASDALLEPLRPLFGDSGMPIERSTPSRWYLRLLPDAPLPVFADPAEALGADMFEHLPTGDVGRRWRALLSEAQVALHNSPVNEERIARGLAPVNSVWFWGAGKLPTRVIAHVDALHSDDEVALAFATFAKIDAARLDSGYAAGEGRRAFDLRFQRRLDVLCSGWIEPALADLANRKLSSATLSWADGTRFDLARSQALRFWKRPLRILARTLDA